MFNARSIGLWREVRVRGKKLAYFNWCRLRVIAGNISPIDVITHVPILCEESDIPYVYVPSKEETGKEDVKAKLSFTTKLGQITWASFITSLLVPLNCVRNTKLAILYTAGMETLILGGNLTQGGSTRLV